MKVKPNLYLNMSPQTTEEGGLAFARNMKLDDDGNLVSDYGYDNISSMADYNIVGHIVGLDNKIYFFCATEEDDYWTDEVIVEYDEIAKTKEELTTKWTYNGGEIDGYVSTNQSGENILTVAEYKEGAKIPLKHINLSYGDVEDESVYCQAPVCPTANLVLVDTYVKTIPNGVYVFFIRYKIRKDVYTNWFLCSRPIFGGTSEKITTLQGGLSYINLHKDSAKSFVFQLDFAQNGNIESYKEFQLGFIITHDEATDARVWKHFDTSKFVNDRKPHYHEEGYNDENLIYFDYENVEEFNIDEFLETTYELYNVRNVTSFKNKLYISNYKETNFNEDLENLADCVTLKEIHSGGNDINYKSLKLYNTELKYDTTKGYYTSRMDDVSILSLLSKYSFNFTTTKLIKTSSKTKDDVFKFSLIWQTNDDPDIAVVFDIHNYLYGGTAIFGPTYDNAFYFSKLPSPRSTVINEGMGIQYQTGGLDGKPYIYNVSSSQHPWLALGFTFAFGSFKRSNTDGNDYVRQGCSFFNLHTNNHWEVDGIRGWVADNDGFDDIAKDCMATKLKEELESKSFWAIAYIEVYSGAQVYTIDYSDIMDLDNYAGSSNELIVIPNSYFSTESLSYELKTIIEDYVYNKLFNSTRFKGLDENGTPVIGFSLSRDEISVSAVSVKFKKFDFKLEEDGTSSGYDIYRNFRISMTTTDYTSVCNFSILDSALDIIDDGDRLKQISTLMPLSTYQPYIHFVDDHNIVSNGIKLDPFTTKAAESDTDVITLAYNVSDVPDNCKYKSFFISLVNIGDIVIEGFDYRKYINDSNVNILNSIELDSMLYNINNGINIESFSPGGTKESGTLVTDEAKYYPSGASYSPLSFGNCGFISWNEQISFDNNERLYIIVKREKSFENINSLIKSSNYLPFKDTEEETLISDGYYGSWLCLIKKPNFVLSSNCYVSGKDIYTIDRKTNLQLTEFNKYIQTQNSITYCIRSNFNLNYLTLTEDINDNIFSVGNASSGVKQVAKVINSATLSSIYELKSMYRDFSNKYFRRKEEDNYKTQFDNTVRVSNVLSDETFNNSIFKFASTDYYNIPTDRGIIVNLFSIGNNIFVHCKGSLYKFDGNATIAANDKDIQLQSAEPFNVGISQIIDSEYGYGGIATKQAGCITFDSYFFYDKASNHIFAYGGNSQIQLIDSNVYKLLTHYKPSECKTIHDEANCRVLFEFTSGRPEHNLEGIEYKTFTLSYNYKTKSFVSFHDISLVKAFSSSHKAYSYKSALINLFNTENIIDTSRLVEGMNVNQIFGGATTACIIEFGSRIYKKQASPFGIAIVLLPQSNLKETVDSIKYVADIQQLDPETQSNLVYDVLVNPQVTRNNPVINFYIITDSCISSLVTTNVDDTARPNSLLDYKGFKYDMGFWTSNYFRNNINKIDIYNYGKKYPNRDLDADNNSLVYGRYFILVFDFKQDTPIKFEDIYMNTNKY